MVERHMNASLTPEPPGIQQTKEGISQRDIPSSIYECAITFYIHSSHAFSWNLDTSSFSALAWPDSSSLAAALDSAVLTLLWTTIAI